MKSALVVLWLYSVSGFSIGGGIHTGPGWWSTRNVFTDEFMKHCYTMGASQVAARESVTEYGCYYAGDGPPEEDWAKVRR